MSGQPARPGPGRAIRFALVKADAATGRLAQALAYLSGGLLLTLALFIVFDVVARRFGFSTGGTDEVAGLVEAVVVAAALAFCYYGGHHVKLDLLNERYPATIRKIVHALAELLMCCFTAVVGFSAWQGAVSSMTRGNRTLLLGIDLFWTEFALAIGLLVLSLAALLRTLLILLSPPEHVDIVTLAENEAAP